MNKTITTIFGHYISLLICMRHLRVTHTTDKETQYYYFAAVVVFLFVMRLTLLAILGLGGDFSGESKQEVKEADFVYASFNLLIKSPAPIPIRQAIGRCTHAHVKSPKKTTHSPGGLQAQGLSLFPAGCSCFLQLLRIPTHGPPLLISSHLLRLLTVAIFVVSSSQILVPILIQNIKICIMSLK